MNEHTPGPWSVAPNGTCVFTDAFEEGRGVAHCGMASRTPAEIHANAHLIAACPEMRRVLVDAPVLSRYHGNSGFDRDRFIADYEAWMTQRREVLFKATVF